MIIQRYDYKPLNRTTVEGKRHYALPDGSKVPVPEIFLPFGTAIDLDAAEVMKLGQLASGSFREQCAAEWAPQPFWTEWCIEIGEVVVGKEKRKGKITPTPAPLHRFFVRKLPSELRVATVITSDMGC